MFTLSFRFLFIFLFVVRYHVFFLSTPPKHSVLLRFRVCLTFPLPLFFFYFTGSGQRERLYLETSPHPWRCICNSLRCARLSIRHAASLPSRPTATTANKRMSSPHPPPRVHSLRVAEEGCPSSIIKCPSTSSRRRR